MTTDKTLVKDLNSIIEQPAVEWRPDFVRRLLKKVADRIEALEAERDHFVERWKRAVNAAKTIVDEKTAFAEENERLRALTEWRAIDEGAKDGRLWLVRNGDLWGFGSWRERSTSVVEKHGERSDQGTAFCWGVAIIDEDGWAVEPTEYLPLPLPSPPTEDG